MSFEKRKLDAFLTIKLKEEIMLFDTEPSKLDDKTKSKLTELLKDRPKRND